MIDVAATLDFTKTSLGLSIADAQELNAHYLEAHGGDRAAITDASGIHHIGSCHHRLFPGRGHHPVDPVPPLRSVATGEDPGGIGFHEVIHPIHFPFAHNRSATGTGEDPDPPGDEPNDPFFHS